MRRAIELAERGRGLTSPNPMVGAVIVAPGGEVVGEGFHARAGAAHAEVEALQVAGGRARGATVYVTLEPCAHHGRTSPCAHALVAAGVARVVAAVGDPNPLVTTSIPAWRSSAKPLPDTSGLGSPIAATTRATPAATRA